MENKLTTTAKQPNLSFLGISGKSIQFNNICKNISHFVRNDKSVLFADVYNPNKRSKLWLIQHTFG